MEEGVIKSGSLHAPSEIPRVSGWLKENDSYSTENRGGLRQEETRRYSEAQISALVGCFAVTCSSREVGDYIFYLDHSSLRSTGPLGGSDCTGLLVDELRHLIIKKKNEKDMTRSSA